MGIRLWRKPVSRTDAPTLGFFDMLKRRRANRSETQREADLRQAGEKGEWTPTTKAETQTESESTPRDSSGINPQGVVDESMTYMRRA